MPAQFKDVNVGTKVAHVFDELPRGPGKAILAETVHAEQRNVKQWLVPRLWKRPKPGNHERPAIVGSNFVSVLLGKLLLGDPIDGGTEFNL